MISKIELHQRFKAFFPYLTMLALVFSPCYTVLILSMVIITRKSLLGKRVMQLINTAVLLVDVMIIVKEPGYAIWNAAPTNIAEWAFGISPVRLLVPLLAALLSLWLGTITADELFVEHEKKKRFKRLRYMREFPFTIRTHEFIAGTTGSGKTTLLLQHIQDSIQNGEALYILSGKNGTDDPRSLLNITKKLATQSIADLDAVDPTFSEEILENCGQYAILQLNSAQDAERMANLIGTYDTVETTRQTSGPLLSASGAGTKKVVHEYKVSPDYIKALAPLCAVYYNKQQPEQVHVVKVPYITNT